MATSTDNPVDLDAAPRDNGASAIGTKLKRRIRIILSCRAPNGRRNLAMLRVRALGSRTTCIRKNVARSAGPSFIAASWSIIAVVISSGCSQQSSAEATGEHLANEIVRLSDHGTQEVTLKQFADTVCFLSEGTISPRAAAERLFPDATIEHVGNYESHGVWFIVTADDKSKTAKIYPVKQTVLRWPISEDMLPQTPCPTSVRISDRGNVPEIDPTRTR